MKKRERAIKGGFSNYKLERLDFSNTNKKFLLKKHILNSNEYTLNKKNVGEMQGLLASSKLFDCLYRARI